MTDEPNNYSCYGCNSKGLCMEFFLTDYLNSDRCPCGMCLVKMICSKRVSCKDHDTFWRKNVRESECKGNQYVG